MNIILKLARQDGLLSRLNALNKLTANSYSKKGHKDDKCPFNDPNRDILKKIRPSTHTESSSSKTCAIFYTGPPSKKSICEQRRIKKCLKYQYEMGCKVEKSKCKGLAPDCRSMPNKEVPGRDKGKNIPGSPKPGWKRKTK